MSKQDNAKEQVCMLNSCLFFSTTKLSRVFGKLAEDAFCKTGLSPSHAVLLYRVNVSGGLPQKELGEFLHLTPSTITRLIEKLERKHLVKKQSEGKQVYLKTTPEGLALQEEIIQSLKQLHNSYGTILTQEETAQFIQICGKLLEKLEKENN